MAFKELKLVIVFIFALLATLIPRAWADKLVTSPEGKSFELPVGRPFAITCDMTAEHSGITTMIWEREDKPAYQKNISNQKIKDSTLKLVFSKPTSDESGPYVCRCDYVLPDIVIYGSKYQTAEKRVYINFYDPELRFQNSFENVMADDGSDLVVSCSAIGQQNITYEWHNQYQEVVSSNSSSRIYTQNLRNESILKIHNIRSSEAGSYTCTASNKYGRTWKEYEILICSSAGENKCNSTPYVRHVQVVNLTANSVKFGISASGAASSIIVRYTDKSFNKVYEKEWKRGDSYEVRGLDPGESYIFNFKAIPLDKDFRQTTDDDAWSKAQEIVTLPFKPDVVIEALSGGTVKIEWIEHQRKSTNTDKYKLTYFPVTLYEGKDWTSTSCPITIDIPACSNVDYSISGLSSKTYYELQLQAHTASGYGEPYKQKIYIQ